MLKDCLHAKDFCRDFVQVQTKTTCRPNKFSLFRLLQICAALLLCIVAGMSQADAQTAVVTASAANTSPGSGTATYSASVSTTNPALNSEQEITNVTYSWSSSDTCNPTTGSSTTVTATRTSPGSYSSSVSCNVTWYILNTHTNQTTTASAGGGATVSFKLGVLWAKGTITGGILTSPQNQTNSPYTPTVVVTSSGAQLTCTVSGASASDPSTFTYGSTTVNGSGADTVSYQWTASAGTLGSATSASTTWTAPTTPQSSPVTLTCTISATAPAVVVPDGGQRGPSSKTATVQIYIPTLTVTGGSWNPNPATAGQLITCNVSASVTPSIPGEVDNVTWTSSGTYYSPDGSDPFTGFGGSGGYVYGSSSMSTTFTAEYDIAGYYLIAMTATDNITVGGTSVASLSGVGYVGNGGASDIAPPDGTYGQDGANVRARALKAHAAGGGGGAGIPVNVTVTASGSTTSNGSQEALTGQSVSVSINSSSLPAGYTVQTGTTTWSGLSSGTLFSSYNPQATSNQLTAVPSSPTGASVSFSDFAAEAITATVNATLVNAAGNTIPATGNVTVTFVKPTVSSWTITSGVVRSYSGSNTNTPPTWSIVWTSAPPFAPVN